MIGFLGYWIHSIKKISLGYEYILESTSDKALVLEGIYSPLPGCYFRVRKDETRN